MPRITVEMLRKRAEHNDGCLTDLKEVTLHQQDIEKIEVIGDCCRQLEILYLCNNYIAKLEGLRHLKWLKYLNLAVNNITVIEGLEGCEALERLDLTLNFIADATCVRRLRANPFLESLHLTGNPCTQLHGYRPYVIHALPHLTELDGEAVQRTERIVARQADNTITQAIELAAAKAQEAERVKQAKLAAGEDPFPAKYNAQGERVYGHSPEERLQMLREQQAEEARRKREADEPAPGSISALHKEINHKAARLSPEEELAKYGRLLMRNEGKVPFTIQQDDGECVCVTVSPGKFIATSLIDVQVEVRCVRVYIKGKLLQLPTEVEMAPDSTTVQRSTTTGELKIVVPLAQPTRGHGAQVVAAPSAAKSSRKEQAPAADQVAGSSVTRKASDLRKALLFEEDCDKLPCAPPEAASRVFVEEIKGEMPQATAGCADDGHGSGGFEVQQRTALSELD